MHDAHLITTLHTETKPRKTALKHTNYLTFNSICFFQIRLVTDLEVFEQLGNVRYRRCTGFGPLFQLQSKIKNMQRLKCNIFFTPTFELKFLLSIAPIVKNGVQLEVGFFLKKPSGPKSYAEHLTWALQNFHSINYILFFA